MAAIRDFAFNYHATTTATTILVPMPDYQENDLLVAVLSTDTGTTQAWSCTGWTQLFSQSNTVNLAVMYKIASASEPADYTFTYTIAETANGAIISIRDVDTSTPFNGTPGYATANGAALKGNMPAYTTDRNNCLILYLIANTIVAVPSILEGACTLLFGKDGSAHSDGCSWGIQANSGTTPSNIGYSQMGASAITKLATVAINPPSAGATVIPAYCASDSSIYLSPFTGAVYNGDAALVNTVTTDFETVLNGKTLAVGGTTYTRADQGLNPYHAMANCMGIVTVGSWAGDVYRFATANKPNVSGKNIFSTPNLICLWIFKLLIRYRLLGQWVSRLGCVLRQMWIIAGGIQAAHLRLGDFSGIQWSSILTTPAGVFRILAHLTPQASTPLVLRYPARW